MRAIDADKLLREMPKDDVLLSSDMRRIVVDAPTLDTAPVIRCRECKYAKYEIGCVPLHWCNAFYRWICVGNRRDCEYLEMMNWKK